MEVKYVFFIKDDQEWDKCDEIWDVIKNRLGIKFHSQPVYEYRYLKAKVREVDGVMKKKICIILAVLAKLLNSVINIDRKNYPQVYLEECKYRIKIHKHLDL